MRYSKNPLARTIFRRVVFLGALIMLVWMPYHVRDTNEKLAKDAVSAYRIKGIADSKDALMQVVYYLSKERLEGSHRFRYGRSSQQQQNYGNDRQHRWNPR